MVTTLSELLLLFQSTLPHGSDSLAMQDDLVNMQFQSTLPHGSDAVNILIVQYLSISIHAPSRERLLCFGWFPSDVRFQSTLPHGSDCS